ncbi:MAG: OmpA family protein, partial [Methylocystis sp.]|nr:OmpA family protein [Methylocystis sp.]
HGLARLAEGSAKISGTEIILEGTAFHEKAAPDIQSQFDRALPEGFKGAARISARTVGSAVDAARCRQMFANVLSKARISFDADNATISADSIAAVDALAAAALRCKDLDIEISGHTEAGGVEEVNRDVSKRRAQAVIDYLTKAGADPLKLTAVGYGGAHPIAPSDSEDGRARNRRIEFLVK